jgi:outer membrane receptor protein involved in Fe transport
MIRTTYFKIAMALGTVSIMAMTGAATPALAQAEAQRMFDIPAQPLAKALGAFSRQAGVVVGAPARFTRGKAARAVTGNFTPLQALSRLVAGTGLTVRRTGPQTFTVAPVQTASLARDASMETGPGDDAAAPASEPASQAAQDGSSSDDGEYIVVTAQKREERLLDVPVPVTAVRGAELAETNALRLQDYYTRVPGLSLSLTGNNAAPVIAIRGITSGGTGNPTTGIMVDDVSYGSSISLGNFPAPPDVDPGELERVEVLRGPQGTLYGASSIGGLLKFVTADPSTRDFSGRIQLGAETLKYSDEFGYTARASVNVPLSDTLAVRASGYMVREPGYIDNAATGQEDINRRDSRGFRLAALWRPSDTFSLKLEAMLQKSERDGTQDVDVSLAGGPKQALLRGSGIYDRKVEAYSATINTKLGGIDLVSITGYNRDTLTDSLDLTAIYESLALALFGVPGTTTDWHIPTEKFSQEIRATLPITDRIDWLVGGYFTKENLLVRSSVFAIDPATGGAVGTMYQNDQKGDYRELAAFTNLTIAFSDRFDIQAGARISWIDQKYSAIRTGPFAELFLGGDPSIIPQSKASEEAITYLVTPRFRISPNLMVYARLASGYRPGGPNTACGFVGVPCRFESDETRNYDIGVKGSTLDGRLTFDASLYYIDWDDIQVTLGLPGTNAFYTDNAGKARSKGLELSLEARPVDGLSLTGWIAFNDAELAEDLPPTAEFFGRKGDRLPYSARTSFGLSADQRFRLGSSLTANLGARLSYVGRRVGQFQATDVRGAYPSYTQIDLQAGLEWGSWALTAYVNNVTNTRGILRIHPDVFFPDLVSYTDPRSFGLNLVKTF